MRPAQKRRRARNPPNPTLVPVTNACDSMPVCWSSRMKLYRTSQVVGALLLSGLVGCACGEPADAVDNSVTLHCDRRSAECIAPSHRSVDDALSSNARSGVTVATHVDSALSAECAGSAACEHDDLHSRGRCRGR
jgi:hypothetical protein